VVAMGETLPLTVEGRPGRTAPPLRGLREARYSRSVTAATTAIWPERG
jgi:hypothetical protein